ncbi:MAG: F0F1 ATP synthase subunit delta [Candidatus Omnitrophica bacterium]|nr:F0F1 ATP synthase subunit delta [Candidatus Omnitrophota bacterium]
MAWWYLLILQVGFFMMLLFVLQRLFHGHLIKAIKRMEGLHDQNLKTEADLKRREEAVMKDCQARIKRLDEEVRARRARAEDEAKSIKEGAMARFEAEHKTMIEELKEKEKSLERRFQIEAQRQGSIIACELVEKTFSPEMLERVHDLLTKELLDLLSKPLHHKITVNGGGIHYKTAYPLSEAQKESLKKKIMDAAKASGSEVKESAVKFKEEVDKSLVAGFTIHLDQLILDGSLKSRFEKQLGIVQR